MSCNSNLYKDANIARMTATLECAVAVLDRDITEETGTADKTLIRLVSLSIVFFYMYIQVGHG